MKPCKYGECTRPSKARGWCSTHWLRWRKHGDPSVVLRVGVDYGTKHPLCLATGCTRPHHARGYCEKHYRRLVKHGDPETVGEVTGRPLKGPNPSWDAVHKRLEREAGPASQQLCVDCDAPASEWSYNHMAACELIDAKRGSPFSLDLGDYDPRCIPCHRRFDSAHLAGL